MSRKKTKYKYISYDDMRKIYYVTFYYGKVHGKVKKEYKTFTDIDSARLALAEHELTQAQKRKLKSRRSEYTLSEWMAYVIEDIKAKSETDEDTLRSYRNIAYRHIESILGHILINELHPEDIQNYYNSKLTEKKPNGKFLSPNTVYKHHEFLKMVLNIAKNYKYIPDNPVLVVPNPPKKEKADIQCYKDKIHIDNLLTACLRIYYSGRQQEPTYKYRYLRIIISLAGYAGLRRSEIMALRWIDCDFEKKSIYIYHSCSGDGLTLEKTKSKKSKRIIPISEFLEKELLLQKDWQENQAHELGMNYQITGRVVSGYNGSVFRLNKISEDLNSLFNEEINKRMPRTTLHGLRHTFATLGLASKAISIASLASLLGHSNPSTTLNVYTKNIPAEENQFINKYGTMDEFERSYYERYVKNNTGKKLMLWYEKAKKESGGANPMEIIKEEMERSIEKAEKLKKERD